MWCYVGTHKKNIVKNFFQELSLKFPEKLKTFKYKKVQRNDKCFICCMIENFGIFWELPHIYMSSALSPRVTPTGTYPKRLRECKIL